MKKMKELIREAIFLVPGFETWFLPATKAIPNELLPIINKLLIQYAVQEALEDHFYHLIELETAFNLVGNQKEAQIIKHIVPKGVECIFVRQPQQLGLGHTVLYAERVVGNETVLNGNLIIRNKVTILSMEKKLVIINHDSNL